VEKNAWKKLLWSVGLLPVLICLPVNGDRATGGIMESFRLAKWHAREHVPLCLVLAFFIAGANGVLVLATWGAPNDRRFKPGDGREFRAAISKAPEDATAAGAASRVKMVKGPDKGEELVGTPSDVAQKTSPPGVWTTPGKAGWRGTAGFIVFCSLVIVMATISGMIFEAIWS